MKKRTLAFLLAFVMILGCFAGLGAGLDEETDFTALSVEEQYSALMSVESDEEAMALFATLDEEQQAALSAYAEAQLDEADAQEDDDAQEDTVAPVTESYPAPAVNFTNVAPFVKHTSSPAKARMLAKAAGQTTKGKAPEGIKLKKTATPNGDGTYTITLEAYATGEKIITEVKNDVPTDIVLVLDQSGSMANCMVCGNEIEQNSTHPTYIATNSVSNSGNNTYYIKDGSDYTRVYYCDGYHGWSGKCDGGAGWYTSDSRRQHTSNSKITPKTSSTTSGTQFYRRDTEACTSRLDALKNSATDFVASVAEKAKGTDGKTVKHRIAVVGYAGDSSNLTNGFKEMDDAEQAASVTTIIKGLTASGGTHIDQGIKTANGIFNDNPVSTDEKRNRVVVAFTDGAPGLYGDWCSESVETANNAIKNAANTKASAANGGYGATVYTIGIFSGADASNPSSLPDYTKYTTDWLGFEESPSEANQVKNSNRFMHLVSSNYPTASSITNPGAINPSLDGKSYYLSAGDSKALSSIFQQISDQIEEGGSSTTLDSKTVIRDIISPQFALPDGATVDNIKLETYACTGKDNNGNYTWKNNNNVMGAKATIASTDDTHETTKNNQVNVTGFDFKENYVGTVTENGTTTYRGNKLVISFVVEPRDGFLGGNDVVTNTSAGVYENDSAKEPVGVFDQPQVDVKIKEPTLTAPDANVYLGANYEQTVSSEELKKDTTIKFGDNIVLDMTKPNDNWGLEDWQTEYVNIEVKITDKDGNPVENSEKLTDDTEYKISVSVTPITPKDDNNGYTKDAAGNIHVFKPVLTFKDSTAYYGEAAATDFSANFVSENWKHGDMAHNDSNVKMLGEKPKLNISYAMDNSELVDNLYYGNEDVHVKATVSINGEDVTEFTTFEHQNCNEEAWTATGGNPAFVIHIKTCTLTVKKSVAETYGNNDSFIFKVVGKGNVPYEAQVVITGNDSATLTGLPVGDYTVTEDTAWSWRYKTDNSTASTTLSSAKARGEVIITNKLNENRWLGDETLAINKCVKNEESSIIKIFMNLLGLD